MENASRSRRYLFGVLLSLLVVLGALAVVNVAIDPLWIYDHRHALNRYQRYFDERQQKTNHVAHTNRSYDCVILGSSRTTYLEATRFQGLKCFNYASSSLYPWHYGEFLDFYAQHRGAPKVVFIGMDFFGTRIPKFRDFSEPEVYIQRATDRVYIASQVVSIDVLRWSLTTAAYNLLRAKPSSAENLYDRDLVKHRLTVSPAMRTLETQVNLSVYESNVYDDSYRYEASFVEELRAMRSRYPASEFVVFTTPEGAAMYRTMVRCGKFASYTRMVRDLVGVFGKVHDFMGINEFTENEDNYMDAHHFYPEAGRRLIDAMWNEPARVPRLGSVVQADTLEAHISQQRESVRALETQARAPRTRTEGPPAVVR